MSFEKELIIKARSGNSAAFLQLYHKYQPVVYRLQRQYYLKDLEPDDWRQEGQIIFFKTLKNYELDRGVSLGYFFKLNFQRHIFSLLRRQGAQKRKTEVYSSSLDAALENQGEAHVYKKQLAEDVSFDYIYLREELSDFNEQLSTLELAVFQAYLAAKSRQEIALKLEISLAQVNNALDRVKNKFKTTLD